MPGFAFRVTGATETAAAFERVAHGLGRLDFSGIGDLARDELERDAPRLTGALAASFEIQGGRGWVGVSSSLIYAAVQNYGHYHNIEGQHFLERSAALVADRSGSLLGDEIDQLISRM